jgi:UDP-N-acetylglucosamine:LPS N-acetylglucosamine transferase
MTKKKLKGLGLYIGTGLGFKSPLTAISDELENLDVQMNNYNTLPGLGLHKLNDIFMKIWLITWRHPLIFDIGYFFAEEIKLTKKFTEIILYAIFRKHVLKLIKKENPDFIFSTFFFATYLFSRVVKKYKLNIPVYGYNSEVVFAPSVLVCNDVEMMYVSTIEGQTDIIRKGQKKEKTKLLSFPLDKKFRKKFLPIKSERKKLNLKDKFTLLVVYGGEGVGNIEPLIKDVIKEEINMQIIVVCGKNKELKSSLLMLKENYPKFDLVVKGYVNNMQDYLYCCDIAAGKSGFNFTFESLFMRKPLLILVAMQNEIHAAKIIVQKELGWWPKHNRNIIEILKNSTKDTKYLNQYIKRIDEQKIDFDTSKIAKDMVKAILKYKKIKI